jgi:ribonuclease-3
MVDFTKFEKHIDFTFKNKDLLTQAFIHRSYLNENSKVGLPHNERLEFLGDAVMELVVTDFLYHKYPHVQEGELTAYRSALVNANIIGQIGLDLKINEFLLLSKGEMRDIGKARTYIIANTFEAIVGSIYEDQGYLSAKNFIEKYVCVHAQEVVLKKLWRDAKSYVQEKSQEHLSTTPVYKVLKESGPDHDKHFTVGIFFGNDRAAEGKGKSKQEAEQNAAKLALEKKGW